MELDTHLHIDTSLCGTVVKVQNDSSEVILHTTKQMSVDKQGLVHGGFVFGAADLAAMSAVNDPYVVLGSSSCKFTAPVKFGDTVLFKAEVITSAGKKKVVDVFAFVDDKLVFEGTFTTFVLEGHVFDM
jgi:acyl-coenzyme A thioesterase PaaI-like protein